MTYKTLTDIFKRFGKNTTHSPNIEVTVNGKPIKGVSLLNDGKMTYDIVTE